MKLTVQRTIELLEEVVEEAGPDHVYEHVYDGDAEECRYVHDGKPDCIAARVFVKAGVPVDDLRTYEGINASAVINSLYMVEGRIGRIGDAGWVEATHAGSVLDVAQRLQDDGRPWGECLAAARVEGASL